MTRRNSNMDTDPPPMPTRATALKIAFWYVGLGTLWIFGSGWMVRHWVHDPPVAEALEIANGWGFVAVTAVVLAVALNRIFRKLRRFAGRLEESEERLRVISDNLPDGYVFQFTSGPDKPRFTAISAGVERVHGLKPADVLRDATCLLEQIVPAQLPAYTAAEAASARSLTDFEMDLQFGRADGEPKLVHVKSRPHRDGDGQVKWDGFAVDVTGQRRADQILIEREHQLRLFIEHSPAAIAMLDRNLRYLVVSRRWMLDHKLGDRDIIGLSHYEVFPGIPEDWKATHQRCLAGAVDKCDAMPLARADGSVDWIRRETLPWYKADGAVGGIILFSEVVTEQKRAEKALRDSELRFKTLIESAPVAIGISRNSRTIYANKRFREMFGYGLEDEMLGESITEHWAPEYRPIIEERARLRTAGVPLPGSFEGIGQRKDGTRFPARVDVTLVDLPDGKASVAFLTDLTEARRAEEERQRLATAVEQSAEAIVITDAFGTILYVNPAFELTTGYSRAEALGQNPRFLKSGRHDTAFYQQMWQTLSRGDVWHGRLVNRHKNGTFYEEEATISPVRDAGGNIVNYIAIKLDVTRQVALEAQFRQAQKMDAIGQLAGGVAHDFNNILAAMIMQADLTATTKNLPEEAREGLKEMRAAAERAANLTRQLLLFSRRQVMQPSNLDLNVAVTSLAKMLQRIIGEDVRMQLILHPSPLFTRADAGMLDQVLVNLAVNGRDAMPGGGLLVIETSDAAVDDTTARRYPDAVPGRYVCVSVRDSGSGIPPEVMPRIFEPFFTTKAPGKGTGLGLATVFGIVQQHRGWLKVDSEPGQGATFRVFLPASAVSPVDESPAQWSKPRGGTETILLAEDDFAVRALTRATLERFGYRVLEADSGLEAGGVWGKHREQVALLLTDLVMPGGMSGQELATRLRKDNPRLKVVYMSGYSAEIAGRALELGPDESFLQKPFQQALLLETIRACLDG